jgi:hypothetical protein
VSIAFTGVQPLFFPYAPSSRADIINAYATILPILGWSISSVTGGFQFRATSPQSLQIDLFVVDLGHHLGPSYAPTATLYFQTTDGSITGQDQELCADGRNRNLIAGPCQFFDAIDGVVWDPQGSCVCGGIPYFPLTSVCQDEIPALATTRGFWAMGDFNSGIVAGFTPRFCLIEGRGNAAPDSRLNCEALRNSDYCAAGNGIGSVRIPTLTIASSIFDAFNISSPILWWNGDFLRIEPGLVWGVNNATLPSIQAQIYDAVIFSKQFTMDSERIVDGLNWHCFTDASYLYGGLHLLVPSPVSASSYYAYVNP